MNIREENSNIIETVISVFTVDKGIVKILLIRKKNEPYKGYWTLPGGIVKRDEVIENNVNDALYERVGITDIYMCQCHVFSNLDRNPEGRVIAVSFMGLIDSVTLELKKEERNVEYEWFRIDSIPKMAYDYESIINDAVNNLRLKLVNINILKLLFPSDFTLPEVQKVFEQILGKKLDRRNFRKKFINLGLIEDTGYKNDGFNGRPAKLYSFKNNDIERNLF